VHAGDADDGTRDGRLETEMHAQVPALDVDELASSSDDDDDKEEDEDDSTPPQEDDEVVEQEEETEISWYSSPMGIRRALSDQAQVELQKLREELGESEWARLQAENFQLKECIMWMDNLSAQKDELFNWLLEEQSCVTAPPAPQWSLATQHLTTCVGMPGTPSTHSFRLIARTWRSPWTMLQSGTT
jgi:hypothetical protein